MSETLEQTLTRVAEDVFAELAFIMPEGSGVCTRPHECAASWAMTPATYVDAKSPLKVSTSIQARQTTLGLDPAQYPAGVEPPLRGQQRSLEGCPTITIV